MTPERIEEVMKAGRNYLTDKELRELCALALAGSRLPVTADGVRVVPGMTVCFCDPMGDEPLEATYQLAMPEFENDGVTLQPYSWNDIYSTREAALAAQQGGEA